MRTWPGAKRSSFGKGVPRRRDLPGPPTGQALRGRRSDVLPPARSPATSERRAGPTPSARSGCAPAYRLWRRRVRRASPLAPTSFAGSSRVREGFPRRDPRDHSCPGNRAPSRIDSLAPNDANSVRRLDRRNVRSTGARPRSPHAASSVLHHRLGRPPTRINRTFPVGEKARLPEDRGGRSRPGAPGCARSPRRASQKASGKAPLGRGPAARP